MVTREKAKAAVDQVIDPPSLDFQAEIWKMRPVGMPYLLHKVGDVFVWQR